jgi:hypothetical protein
MKAGHSKLDGYSATLPAMRPSPRLPTVVVPLLSPFFFASMRSYLRSSTHRLPYRPKLPSRYRLPHPPLLLLPSIPLATLPNLCLPTSSIPPASYHFTHCYAHALRPPPLSFASIVSPCCKHPQRLSSLGYPSTYLLLIKLVKHFCWMLLGYLPYLLSSWWGKNKSHRKWY